jgi:Protein of unknown function (DUF3095)
VKDEKASSKELAFCHFVEHAEQRIPVLLTASGSRALVYPVPPDSPVDHAFFATLPAFEAFADVVRPELYRDVPASWWVLLSDVRGSTRAIEAGRYRDVNAVGVATIIALRNALPEFDLPYVFGGDGATALVPGDTLEVIDSCLRGVRRAAAELFDLELRVARVPVAALQALGHRLRVGRFAISRHIRLAVLEGDGFQVAESWVKQEQTAQRFAIEETGPCHADFEGFECRWQPVKSRRGQIVSLIIVALPAPGESPEPIYRAALEELDRVLQRESPCPVSATQMRPTGVLGNYEVEARLRSQSRSGAAFKAAHRYARQQTAVGRLLRAVGGKGGSYDGATYLDDFVTNADFRKFDGGLRMVLDLKADESEQLVSWLEARFGERRLVFGVHQAPEALVTCLVKDYSGDHVHFIDGSNGGYALAAKELKLRLRQLSETR